MKKATLCFLVRGDEVLLAMKKRGFGEGKWNGVGGKVKEGESFLEGALRETEEEIGVSIKPENAKEVGVLYFHWIEKPEWDQEVHVFFASEWDGEPSESEEMLPQWYKQNSIPFEVMWVDDKLWLPKVLEGKNIEASFYFGGDGSTIDRYELKEI